jgi:geranylgeranyl pyrophosphate synthase
MTSKETLVQKTVTLLRERGKEALEVAKQSVQQEKIGYKPLQEALNYFIEKVLNDVMQPGLLSLYCEAVGGKPSETTQVGAAMVLLVAAADLHDDLIDCSTVKNGKSTVFGKYGKDITVLAGDAFLIKGIYLLHEAVAIYPEKKRKAILDLIKQAFFDLSSGEAEEANHRGKDDLSGQQYLEIIKKKVVVSEATAKIGAILGNGKTDHVKALADFGRTLGLLSTIRDEFIDIFESEELGNRTTGEILPLPILYVFQDPKKKDETVRLLKSGKITKKKIEKIVDLVMKAEEIDELRQVMHSQIQESNKQLASLKDCKETLELLLKSSLEDLS